MIHWGVELDARPREYQVEQAHRMIDAGADVIFGSHPHTLQPMETYRGRPIFYSLGNLVWPRVTSTTSATAVAEVVVASDGSISGRLIPAEIVSDGHPVLITPPQNRPTSDARPPGGRTGRSARSVTHRRTSEEEEGFGRLPERWMT